MTKKLPTGHGGYRPGAGRKPNQPSPEKQEAQADYNQARARRETALASLAELDLAKQRGELIPADQVLQAWSGIFSVVRSILLGLPSRIAGGVAGAATTQEISAAAMVVVREALYELAESGENGMKKAEAMHHEP
jgi:hypothetical protein